MTDFEKKLAAALKEAKKNDTETGIKVANAESLKVKSGSGC